MSDPICAGCFMKSNTRFRKSVSSNKKKCSELLCKEYMMSKHSTICKKCGKTYCAVHSSHFNHVCAKPVVKPVIESVAEPVAKLVAEPVGEHVAEPVAKPVAKSVAEPAAEPAAEQVVKHNDLPQILTH